MLTGDYVHQVRLHEQESQADPRRYRRKVLMFALLGYGVLLLAALLAVALLGWVMARMAAGGFRGWMVWPLLASLGLLWSVLAALRPGWGAAQGERLSARDAPALFDALDKIRRKVNGPPLHEVRVDGSFNASIEQRPRWLGLGQHNVLTLGWPLLAALEPRRVLVVVAHEYGHLRGDHGRLSAWIYRTRRTWGRLYHHYREDDSLVAAALVRFVGWYFPRFDALSFALARQDEYEADRVAVRLFGAEAVTQTLQEIELKAAQYDEQFWAQWWRLARISAPGDAPPTPFQQMPQLMLRPPEPALQRRWLRRALQRLPDPDDTHPVLRDRLAAVRLGPGGQDEVVARPRGDDLPALSGGHSLRLLGQARARVAMALDKAWWREARGEWGRHGERLRTLWADAQRLKAKDSQALSVADWLRLAEAREVLSGKNPLPQLEQALALAPEHETLLLRLVRLQVPEGDPRAGEWLERLHGYEASAWRAATLAQDWLDEITRRGQPPKAELRRLWRKRLQAAQALEDKAWETFSATPPWERSIPVVLEAEALRELRGDVLSVPGLRSAWISEQDLDLRPRRRHFAVWLQLRRRPSPEQADLIAQRLHQRLDLPGRCRVLVVGRHVEPERMKGVALTVLK